MMDNAARIGGLLKARLQDLMQRFEFIGDVRGEGLLLAFELVADRRSMRPLPREKVAFDRLVEIAYDKGLIIYSRRTRGGYEGDHFLVCPPMITTDEQVEEIIDMLTGSLEQLASELNLASAGAA